MTAPHDKLAGIKPGDRVTDHGWVGTLLAIHEDRAWVCWDQSNSEALAYPLYDDSMLSDLERIP